MKKIIVIMTFLLSISTISIDASVKTMNKTIKMNKVYTSYDITGDNKKDRIQLKYSQKENGDYKRMTVYINKKKAYTLYDNYDAVDFSSEYGNSHQYIRLSNNKKYLLIRYNGFVGYERAYLLEYQSGKLKKVKNLEGLPGLSEKESFKYSGTTTIDSIKLNKNTLTVSYFSQFFTTANMGYKVNFTYKSGKFVKSQSAAVSEMINADGKHTKTLKARKTIQVYKNISLKTKSFKIKKNQKVTFLRIGGTSKKYYVKVKVGKKTGYIKAFTSHDGGNPYFYNLGWVQ